MTRPKFRPCASCQAPNQASRKTCSVCYRSLSTKQKLKEKVESLDGQWGKGVLKNRNVGRIIDSARIAVRKLEAIGYKPILFIGKKDKVSNKWVADVITHLDPTSTTRNFLEKMQRAYEFILTKGSSTPVQPDIPTEQQCVEQPEMTTREPCVNEQGETLINEHPETLTDKQGETIAVEDPKMQSDEQAESIFVLNLVPVSPSSPCSQSFQKKKRERSTSPIISTISPPHVTATDRPSVQSFYPPAHHEISQSLSQGGPCEKKGRKGCRKCSRQKMFKFEAITGSRINEGKAEVKVRWVPCSLCGKIWDDTWEPAGQFQHHFAMSEVPPPSASEQPVA